MPTDGSSQVVETSLARTASVLDPMNVRHAERDIVRQCRADTAYAILAICAGLEEAVYPHAIQLPGNDE